MIKSLKISVLVSLFINTLIIPLSLLSQGLDTVCMGDQGDKLYINGSIYNSVSIWNVEGENQGVVTTQVGDTLYVDWNTSIPGFYKVSVKEYNIFNEGADSCGGNTVFDSVFVTGPTNVAIAEGDAEVCFGEVQTYSSLNQHAEYLWFNGVRTPEATINTDPDFNPTDYNVWLEATDNFGCSFRDTVVLTVHALPEIDLGPNREVCDDQVVDYDFSNEGVAWDWYAKGELFSQESYQEFTVSSLYRLGTDTIMIHVENEFTCEARDTVVLTACANILGEIYTVITPNGDGSNDDWGISRIFNDRPYLYPDMVVEIFDRWGKIVWKSQPGYTERFEGLDFNGKKLPLDSYFFVINLNNGGEPITGHVTIVK